MLEVLSLGAGVQSTAVLLMSVHGELPKLDHAIFADTGWEPARVYKHLEWLKGVAESHGIEVHIVSQGDLRADALVCGYGKKINGHRVASLPLFTRKVWTEEDIPTLRDAIQEREEKEEETSRWSMILRNIIKKGTYNQDGMIRRQCTYEYKIRPVEICLRRTILGLKPRQHAPKEPVIRQWRGISVDEWQRVRKSDHQWMVTWHPLVERRISRQGCHEWMRKNGYPESPRSACIGCPYHSAREWRQLRDNSPEEWEDACTFDEAIRECGGMRGLVYLHDSRTPLRTVDLSTREDFGQLSLWQNECEGMCGV